MPCSTPRKPYLAPCTTEESRLNGLRLHWRTWGNPDNPPVICLHGAWGQSAYWQGVAKALEQDYYVIALDQRGHGASQWTDSYGLNEFADDVQALSDHLCRRHQHWCQVRLVGLSLGGLVAITYAGRQPPSLMQLVVVDIGPELTASAMISLERSKAYPKSFVSLDAACDWAIADGLWSDGPRLKDDLAQRLYQDLSGRWHWRADAKSWATRGEWLNSVRLWRAYEAIACPLLVVRGGDSGLLDEGIMARMLTADGGTRAVTIAGAGHSVPSDQPQAFVQQLKGFFRGYGAADTR